MILKSLVTGEGSPNKTVFKRDEALRIHFDWSRANCTERATKHFAIPTKDSTSIRVTYIILYQIYSFATYNFDTILNRNEKEGIPVDLIQMLDVCVEIPQTGVIRSLNVHVSGAILIWEYARQHPEHE